MVFLLLLALLSQRPARWPIESLTVEGNRNYSPQQIFAVAGLKVGQLAGKEEFEAAQKRLEATGAFETISYRFSAAPNGSGYVAVFQVVEVEPVYPVRFEGLGVPDQDLNAWLQAKNPLYGPKIPGTKATLDRYTKSIQEFLATRNRHDPLIAKLVPTGTEQFTIVFRPARAEPTVAEISFEGNQVIPTKLLQDAIGGVAVGVPYTEAGFRELLNNAVRPLYDARGRIRVSFPKITAQKARDVDGVAVHVVVDEGASYDLGDVTLDNKSEVKTADLMKSGDFKKGDLANFDEVAKGVERIRKRLRRQGYMRAAATLERHIDDAKKTVAVVVHIDEGPQFMFGKLNIEGLDLNGEAAVKKLWALKDGKPFDADYPDYFLKEVRDRGIFDNLGKTKSALAVNEKDRSVDVTLYFGSASTGSAAPSPK